jgi:hypothetical protein
MMIDVPVYNWVGVGVTLGEAIVGRIVIVALLRMCLLVEVRR